MTVAPAAAGAELAVLVEDDDDVSVLFAHAARATSASAHAVTAIFFIPELPLRERAPKALRMPERGPQ